MKEDKIEVGDRFKGKVNGAIFEITEIDNKNKVITYKCNGEKHCYGLEAFKRCLLEKVDEED